MKRVIQSKKIAVQFFVFSKNNSVPIHKFIFNHYSQEMNDNPSSRAIFEKKLMTIASTIKDEFLSLIHI